MQRVLINLRILVVWNKNMEVKYYKDIKRALLEMVIGVAFEIVQSG